MAKLSRVYLEGSIVQMYKCKYCAVERSGDRVSVKFSAGGSEGLEQFLGNVAQSPNNMPIGWSSNGSGVYSCGCHKGIE